jgi:hypothetical protein
MMGVVRGGIILFMGAVVICLFLGRLVFTMDADEITNRCRNDQGVQQIVSPLVNPLVPGAGVVICRNGLVRGLRP